MPALEHAQQFQIAVLWPFRGFDRRGQAMVSDVAREVSVRWDTKRRQLTRPDGSTVAYDGSAILHEEVRVGSVMWLGTFRDLTVGVEGQVVPQPPWRDNLFEVKAVNGTPDVKGRGQQVEVMLMRYKGVLPNISELS